MAATPATVFLVGLHRLHIHCMKCIQSDLKIFIFRLQIYIILIHLLEIPYFDIVVLK